MGTGSRRINGETGEIIMLCSIYIHIYIHTYTYIGREYRDPPVILARLDGFQRKIYCALRNGMHA